MTRQSPDELEYSGEHYPLYPFPPLLPEGHPRWKHCRIAPGTSTANYRGYRAQWAVRGGRLFLKGFGGYAEEGDGAGPQSGSVERQRTIGMIDVHEVDAAVPATWISCNLVCPVGSAAGTRWDDFIPERFLLLRVVRGTVMAEMSVANTRRAQDMWFCQEKTLLDQLLSDCGASRPALALPALDDLGRALRYPSESVSRRRLAAMLWQAGEADLAVLIPALTLTDDPDIQRWIGYTLARIGPGAIDAIPHLMHVLASTGDPAVAAAMAYALGGIGPAAAPVFAAMIPIVEACCEKRACDQIVHFVDNLAPAGWPVIDRLIAGMLASRDGRVQARISFCLGEMGGAAVLPLYAAFLAAGGDRQRSVLASALGGVGPKAGIALDRLLDGLLHARSDEARAAMAEAIAKIGLRSLDSLPPLRAAFRAAGDSRAVRGIAEAASSLGGAAVGFLVEEFETAGTEEARTQIARALGKLGAAAAPAAGLLAEAIEGSTHDHLIEEVASVLKTIGAPVGLLFTTRIKQLRCDPRGYRSGDVLDEMQATLAAGLRPSERDVQDLVALLVEAGESATGRAVAKMLGVVGKAAAAPLLSALDRVREPGTRRLVLHALGQVGKPADSVLDDAVVALAAANNDRERLQIVDDLRRMGRPDERHMATIAAVLVRSSFLPVWWRLGLVLAEFGGATVATLVGILEGATEDELCRAMENALLEVATSDPSAGPALMAAARTAKSLRTKQALQAALARSLQR